MNRNMNAHDDFDRDDHGDFERDNGRDDPPMINVKKAEGLPVIGPLLARIFDKGPRVAVVRLSGVLTDMGGMRKNTLSYARVSKAVEKAFAVRGVRAVALVINSPGGAPAQASLIAGLVRQLADEKDIPVFAFVEDVAASGGYWLACAGDKIYAQDCSIVGSIGVISAGFGMDRFISKFGITRRLYTAGRDKSMLDPFSPEKPEDVERLKDLQAGIHEQFIDWVRSRRGDAIRGSGPELFEGRFWIGRPAIDLGLIDGIGDVRGVMREKFGPDVRLIETTAKPPFVPAFLAARSGGIAFDETALVDGAIAAVEDRALWSRYGL
ncbi:S49 family peptidase [Micavibrio aeruginosavorus]|uniref:Peptidase S49 family protein n=1 Tax=Micavibrio aeruginosavorus (strain ARL-13) TaxID=856793 RepID=G2KRT9_MICAA|nr:peptidase S49 family protein [Micavibrio aeruginosavorus ARL-13]